MKTAPMRDGVLFILLGGAFSLRVPTPSMQASSVSSLEQRYAAIAAALPRQQEAYKAWLDSGLIDTASLIRKAGELGLDLDVAGGQIAYATSFKPLELCFDLIYCRYVALKCHLWQPQRFVCIRIPPYLFIVPCPVMARRPATLSHASIKDLWTNRRTH